MPNQPKLYVLNEGRWNAYLCWPCWGAYELDPSEGGLMSPGLNSVISSDGTAFIRKIQHSFIAYVWHIHTHERYIYTQDPRNWIDFICYVTADKSNYLKNIKPKMTIANLNQV